MNGPLISILSSRNFNRKDALAGKEDDTELLNLHFKLKSSRRKNAGESLPNLQTKASDIFLNTAINTYKETGQIESFIADKSSEIFSYQPHVIDSTTSRQQKQQQQQQQSRIFGSNDSLNEGSLQSTNFDPTHSLLSPKSVDRLPKHRSLPSIFNKSLDGHDSKQFQNTQSQLQNQVTRLKKEEKNIEILHQSLQSVIKRLSKQPALCEGEDQQIDVLRAGKINKSLALKSVSLKSESLNSKLMGEAIIKTNQKSNKTSFIKKGYKKNELLELIENDNENEDNQPGKDTIPSLQASTQLICKNNLDGIFNDVKQTERERIVNLAQKKYQNKHKHAYNSWYIKPAMRYANQDYQQKQLYPYVNDPEYLYNNISSLEDLYQDNPFDAKLNVKKQNLRTEQQLKMDHLHNVLTNFDVIRGYTKSLAEKGDRVPLFMKEAVQHDSGKQLAREIFKNKYFSESQASINF